MNDFELYTHIKRDEVVEYFNEHIGVNPCSLCGTGELLILGDETALITVDHEVSVFNPSANGGKDKGVFLSYVVMCENCGCQQFINAKKLAEIMHDKKKK